MGLLDQLISAILWAFCDDLQVYYQSFFYYEFDVFLLAQIILCLITQISMQIQEGLHLGRPKADIAYFNSYMNLTKQRYYSIFLNFLKALQFAILIPSNILKSDAPHNLVVCMTLNLCASVLGIAFSMFSLVFIYRSVTVFLNVADQINHTIADQKTTNLSEIQCCYSQSIYVADSNISIDDINDQTKKLYDNIAKNAIAQTLKTRYNWYRNGQNLYSLVSFTSMIYSIIVLSTTSLNSATETNLIIYVIVVGLSELIMIIGLLALVLSPVICIGICIFCCCCRTKTDQNGNYINIAMKDATMTDIVNAGGDCSICYQNINEKQKIYVLLCSDTHVFHCECLKHWTKVKNNCPICRKQIPMIDHQLQADPLVNQNNIQ